MPLLRTVHFGDNEYPESAFFHFDGGLPGFPDETRFAVLEVPHARPIVFLQSAQRPELCFMALPATLIEPDYRVDLSEEDRRRLDLRPGVPLPQTAAVLALIAVEETQPPTANLLAPVVIHFDHRKGAQVVRSDQRYSHRHPIEREVACSC